MPAFPTPGPTYKVIWPTVPPLTALSPSEKPSPAKPSIMVVRINGREIQVLPNEHTLLKRLLQNNGKPVANKVLWQQINSDYQMLRGVIRGLNEKLRSLGQVQIKPSIGSGYHLTGVCQFSE